MIKVNLATGHVIAAESAALFDAADDALLSSARLTVSILEATVSILDAIIESRLDPRTKQKLTEAMTAGQSKLVDLRKSLTSVHSQLVVLQRRTNLAEVSWGCGELHLTARGPSIYGPGRPFDTPIELAFGGEAE